MLNEIHFWTPSWPVHDLHILLCQKSNCVRCCVGHGIVLDIHKVSSKNARRPGMHTITEKSDIALVSIHHHHFASSSMVDGTPYHDWVATVTICGLKARIYQSPSCLQHTRSQPSLWNSVKWDSSLKTQCLQCPRFHFLCILLNTRRHCLWSKVNLGHLAGSLDWWPAHAAARACLQSSTVTTSFKIGGSSPCTDKEPIEPIVPDHSDQLSVVLGCGQLPCLIGVAYQCLDYITNFANASLRRTQHSWHFSVRIALRRQSYNMHQYLLLQITWHGVFKEW